MYKKADQEQSVEIEMNFKLSALVKELFLTIAMQMIIPK